jgi:uncharacterized membrane protein
MGKIYLLLLTYILTLGLNFNSVVAQNVVPEESIISYISDIVVNIDNSIDVTEQITYNTGPEKRRGIYRDIATISSQERRMSIENITVKDEKGDPYEFETSDSKDSIKIKIGNPDIAFLGQKVYIIKYKATNAIAQLKDLDEIYWNVTGDEWNLPIYQAKASVRLPYGVNVIQSECYYGLKGSKDKCQTSYYENIYSFNTTAVLNPQEGITVAVGFPKGVVSQYSESNFQEDITVVSQYSESNFFDKYWRWLIAGTLPILTLIFSLLNWHKKGRDERGTGIIVPQYDAPDNLTPIEVGTIAKEKLDNSDISAEIIYLATKGYLKIHQMEERFVGLIKFTDFELTRLKDFSTLPNDFDQKLLNSLFNTQPNTTSLNLKAIFQGRNPVVETHPISQYQSIKLSSLKDVFYRNVETIVTSVLDSLLNKGYYRNLGQIKNGLDIFSMIVISVFASLFIGGILGFLLFKDNPFPLIVGIFFSIIIYNLIYNFSSSKTKKGAITKEYILGLKEYLQVAEKDRIKFHNAPEKKPEVFEKLLPYAMVLGVADIWAKEFKEIYTMPPTWYSGNSRTTFSTITLSQSMNNFSYFATSSLMSSPNTSDSSSGSSGSGSSGGGGGGGGGGSW